MVMSPADVDMAITVACTLADKRADETPEALLQRYHAISALVGLEAAGAEKVECLTPGCGTIISLDRGQQLPDDYRCEGCGRHPQRPPALGTTTPEDEAYLARKTVACSGCGVHIQKTSGCDHLTCRCGAHTCWRCGGAMPRDRPYSHFTNMRCARPPIRTGAR